MSKFFWYKGGNHVALVKDGGATLIRIANTTEVTPDMQFKAP